MSWSAKVDKPISTAPFVLLGLHFGHDAAVAVLQDGTIRSYVLRERISRVKHAMAIDMGMIELALRQVGVCVQDVSCVAVSSTQGIELVVDDSCDLDIRYVGTDHFGRPFDSRFAGLSHDRIAAMASRTLVSFLYDEDLSHTYIGEWYRHVLPSHVERRPETMRAVPWLDSFTSGEPWWPPLGLTELGATVPHLSDRLRYGFHTPISVVLNGRTLPGYAVQHHLAHAASSYYQSGFTEAAVLTHDGFGLAFRPSRTSTAPRGCRRSPGRTACSTRSSSIFTNTRTCP